MKIQPVNRIAELLPHYDAFIFSVRGVLCDGSEVYPNSMEGLIRLKKDGKRTVLLSNSSSRTDRLALRLEQAGLQRIFYDGLLTSGEVIYHEMAARNSSFFKSLGSCYYYIGGKGRREDWVDLGYIPVDSLDKAEFIIVTGPENPADGIDRYLPVLRDAAGQGLPLVCLSYDRSRSLGGQEVMGAGAIAYRYEMMGGHVLYRGKPQEDMFQYCLEGMPGVDRSRVLVVGDSFPADISGASKAGLDSLLIASGTHARELGIEGGMPLSEAVIADLSRHFGAFPKYVMREFKY